MKELSIKDKAKAYDEAIERAKKWRNAPNVDKIPTYANRIIEEIFPELKESEDEKIRKGIIKYLEQSQFGEEPYQIDDDVVRNYIAWLEKQGEKSNIHQDAEDDLRRQSTIRILEYARSLDAYNQYGKESINKDIAWLEKQSEISSIIYNSSNIGKNEHKCSWSEEDDKIRKALIELVKYEGGSLKFLDSPFDDVPMDTMLDWLEKQGKNNMGISEATKKKLEDNLNKALEKKTPESWNKFLEKQGEQKETLCDKCKKEQPSHSCQDITALGRCALEKQDEQKQDANLQINPSEYINDMGGNGCYLKTIIQKPADEVKPKFKVGDWIINNDKRIAVPTHILEISNYGYVTSTGYISFDKVKTDYHLWSIQDAKDGDKLILESMFPELAEIEDEKIIKDIISFLHSKNGYMNPNEDWDFHNRWLPCLEKQVKVKESIICQHDNKICKENDSLFPEPKESDGERIRKELYKYFRDLQLSSDREFSPSTNIDEILAWLEKQGEKESDPRYENLEEILAADDIYQMSMNDEMVQEAKEKAVNALSGMCIGRLLGIEKQGEYKETLCEKCKREHPSHSCQDITELGRCAIEHEQKPADKAEPKYKAGDWVQVEHGNIMKILDVSEFTYTILSCYGYRDTRLISDVDSISHLWTIQDAKDGDVLYSPCLSLLWIFKSKDTVYCGCNLNYNDGAFCGEGYFERPTDAIPATKEQRDQLERAMTNAGYRWNKEKLKLEKI